MKVEGWLFVGCAAFFAVMDVIYWHYSKDPTGTTALALSVGLAFLTGFYLLFTGRRLPPRPEDRPDAAIGWGLFLIGMLFVLLSAIGFVFEYYRGQYAH